MYLRNQRSRVYLSVIYIYLSIYLSVYLSILIYFQKHKDLLQLMINASKDKHDKSEDKAGELTYEDYINRGLSSQRIVSRADSILGEITLSNLGLAPFSHFTRDKTFVTSRLLSCIVSPF